MSSTTFTSALDAARRYASIGWPVFPCTKDKKPYTEHGFLNASCDEATIREWWRRWPEAQIGVACGAAGICVVDLDRGNGKDGVSVFDRIEDENGPAWCGLIASTPRGGKHYVYLMPDPPVGIGQDLHAKGSGIDLRGAGGYIVVPSPSSPGREWMVGDPFEMGVGGESDITQMPEWVEDLVRGGRKAPSLTSSPASGTSGVEMPLSEQQVAAIKRALQHIDSDPRDTWIRVGMALKSTGAREQAYDLWTEWSRTSAKFDADVQRSQWASLREFFLDGHEITLGSLFHLAKDAGYVASTADEVVIEAAPAPLPPPKATPRRPFDRGLMNVPGLVGEIAEWMVSCSTRQQPALCLASSIALLGAVIGRGVATPTDLRSNVYCLGIGETACGKDPGVRLPHLLLTRAGLGHLIGPGEWKSDSGLRAALLDAPSHVCCCDEFTKLLAAMSGPLVPGYVRGIKRYLLELWGASNSMHGAPGYANRAENKPVTIEQPNLCVYGTGVPSELFTSLDRGALSDGFLNRILVFFADEQMPPRNKVGRAEPPAELVARLALIAREAGPGPLANTPGVIPDARIVPMTAEADAMLSDLEDENDRRILALRADSDPLSDLWVRFGAQVAKLALIRSACDDPHRAIDVPDVAWARDLVLWCTERMTAEAESRVSDSQQEALTKRVLRLVVDAGAEGLTSGQVTRKTQWLRRSDRKDMLATLVEGGEVLAETREVQRAGRGAVQVTYYVAAAHRSDAG